MKFKTKKINKINKKGSIFTDLFLLIAVFLVAILLFAGFLYGFGQLNEKIQEADIQVLGRNVTDTSQKVFGTTETALKGLQWVALSIFFGMALGIFISNFLVKAHPVFFVVYIILAIFAVIFSVYVSNAYEQVILPSDPLGDTLNENFGPVNYIVLNLPIFITVIGLMGAIFLFVGVTVDREQGGGLT